MTKDLGFEVHLRPRKPMTRSTRKRIDALSEMIEKGGYGNFPPPRTSREMIDRLVPEVRSGWQRFMQDCLKDSLCPGWDDEAIAAEKAAREEAIANLP